MAPSRPLRLVALILAAAAAAGRAQNQVLDALAAGDLRAALDHLDAGVTTSDPKLGVDIAEKLDALSRTAAKDADLRHRAQRWVLRVMPENPPRELAAAASRLARETALAVVSVLLERPLVDDGRLLDSAAVPTLQRARDVLLAAGADHAPLVFEIERKLLPGLLAARREDLAARIGEQALARASTASARCEIEGHLARALLEQRDYDSAIPHLRAHLAEDQSDPRRVLPLVRELPHRYDALSWELLLPVVKSPSQRTDEQRWVEALDTAYEVLDRIDPRRPPGDTIWSQRLIERNLPDTWFVRVWSPGFRVWLDDNDRPGKNASGKDLVRVGLPASAGWYRAEQPPDDLRRWRNDAICLQRGRDGPTLVVYWFGPNLHYWYGDTARERGVTGKTVRGHSTGPISRMVADIAYGVDAAANNLRFKKRSPLPYRLGVRTNARYAYQLGRTVYDESFFSHGEVTIEVLLRIDEAQLAVLEPEIRWLMSTVGKG